MTTKPAIQIVIPVHDETRPIRRAVESVLADENSQPLVIAHNISPTKLDIPEDSRVEILELNRDAGMPGACFDFGIANATSPWVGIMGSDDWYDPGALSAMHQRVIHDKADGIISPLKHQLLEHNQLRPVTYRRRNLQAARDRMFYRTAPLGIFRTTMMQEEQYRFGAIFPAGSDMRVTALLWTSGRSFSYHWNDPAYVVGKDAKTRVTFTPRPLEITGAPCIELLNEERVQEFNKKTRHSLAVKLAKVHVGSAAILRRKETDWLPGDFQWLSNYLQLLRDFDANFYKALLPCEQKLFLAIEKNDFTQALDILNNWEKLLKVRRNTPRQYFDAITQHDSNIRLGVDGLINNRLTKYGLSK
ncbi:MAG: glycosyltransferase [Arcanobacterium sp.]|nr:glycosyltransferase [Arcanobacterium sp.]